MSESICKQYKKYIDRGDLELILETAASDTDITDDEYIELTSYAKLHTNTRAGRTHVAKMEDRNLARYALKRTLGLT